MDNTFTAKHRDVVANTIYNTGNPSSDDRAPAEHFAVVNEVWRNERDEAAETLRPRPLTDWAIAQWQPQADTDGTTRRSLGHYKCRTGT